VVRAGWMNGDSSGSWGSYFTDRSLVSNFQSYSELQGAAAAGHSLLAAFTEYSFATTAGNCWTEPICLGAEHSRFIGPLEVQLEFNFKEESSASSSGKRLSGIYCPASKHLATARKGCHSG
jgi:hypothetical protein